MKMPATGLYVDRIIRVFRDMPEDDGTALVLQDYARAALALAASEAAVAAKTLDAALADADPGKLIVFREGDHPSPMPAAVMPETIEILERTIELLEQQLKTCKAGGEAVEGALRRALTTMQRYQRAGHGDDVFMDDLRQSIRVAETALTGPTVEPHRCPVCDEPFKAGDQCSTDIDLGMCHAECLEGCPTVNLDTGDPVDGPIPTYPYEADDAPQGETADLSLDAPLIERLERASAILANDDVTAAMTTSRARRVFVTETVIEAREKLREAKADAEASEADGIRKAIRFIERRRDAYVEEHGFYDPTTGVTEFPGNGDETVGEWEEIIEELQGLAAAGVGG